VHATAYHDISKRKDAFQNRWVHNEERVREGIAIGTFFLKKKKKTSMKTSLALMSAIVSIAGLILYNRAIKENQRKEGGVRPNMVVLIMGILTAAANTGTYLVIVKDIAKSLLALVVTITNIIITYNTYRSKNYSFLKRDILIGSVATIIVVVIALSFLTIKDIHVVMQVMATIPYFPLIMGIIQRKGVEPLIPWVFSFIGGLFWLGAVMVDYSGGWSLLYPLRSCILQILVIVFVIYKKVSL
jgi:hypothetical protein